MLTQHQRSAPSQLVPSRYRRRSPRRSSTYLLPDRNLRLTQSANGTLPKVPLAVVGRIPFGGGSSNSAKRPDRAAAFPAILEYHNGGYLRSESEIRVCWSSVVCGCLVKETMKGSEEIFDESAAPQLLATFRRSELALKYRPPLTPHRPPSKTAPKDMDNSRPLRVTGCLSLSSWWFNIEFTSFSTYVVTETTGFFEVVF